jgi:hypothetical protein
MKLSIENGKISAVEVSGKNIPLRKLIPIEDYKKLENAINNFLDYIDLDEFIFLNKIETKEYGEFDRETLNEYMSNLTNMQKKFLKNLVENKDRYVNIKIIYDTIKDEDEKKGEFRSQIIAGLESGLTKKARNRFNKENIFEKQKSEIDGKQTYRIKPKYLKPIEESLSSFTI